MKRGEIRILHRKTFESFFKTGSFELCICVLLSLFDGMVITDQPLHSSLIDAIDSGSASV